MIKLILGLLLSVSTTAHAALSVDADQFKNPAHTKSYLLPTISGASDSILTRTDTSTLTNKSMSGTANTFTLIPYSALVLTGAVLNADLAGSIAYSKLNLTGAILNADLAGSIADSKLSTISTAGKVSNSATTATNANTNSAIVARDGSGNFSAGTITAALTGTASGNLQATANNHGVLVSGSGNTATVIAPVASSTKVLTSVSGADPTWAEPTTAVGSYAVTPKTTTYAIQSSDSIVLCSASAFTVTLPTAVGVTGKIYIIKKTDSSLTNIITIATTSSQTLDGNSSLTLNTDQEQYTLVSDGANWTIIDHRWNMSPSTSVATTVTAVTTNPTKPTTGGLIDQDSVVWWRDTAKTAIIEYRYNQHGSTGGATGSGNYLWLIPFTVDTTNVAVYTGALSQSLSNNSIIGNGNTFDNGSASDAYLAAVLYDSTHFRMQRASLSGAFLYAGSTGMAFNASILTYWVRIRVPVSGWSP